MTTDQLINIFAGLLCRVCHNDEPQDNDQTSKFPLVGPSSLLIGQDLVDLSSLLIGQDLVDPSSRDLFKSKQLPILVDLDLGKISFLYIFAQCLTLPQLWKGLPAYIPPHLNALWGTFNAMGS